MTTELMTLEYRRLRAPANDGQSLEIPALEESSALLEFNRSVLSSHAFDINSVPIAQFRQTARRELLTLAGKHTRQYRDANFDPQAGSLILAGHQPSLFHPGVWFKNFCLANLAARHQNVGINLIIDNDLCASKSLRVPTGSFDKPRIENIAFDSAGLMLPYEMQHLHDKELFKSFGTRVEKSLAPIVSEPMMGRYWQSICELQNQFENPFLSIAAARHRFEGTLGLNSLEVPLSTVCNTASFWQFAADLLSRPDELLHVYNETVRLYRDVHHIRSQSHPVPDLNSDRDGWIETPFWVWSKLSPIRRRLMVHKIEGELELSDHAGWKTAISVSQLVEGLQTLSESDVFIRPRALVTTMYARLVLSDLFLHGIGGAKYDQLTDQIIFKLFQAKAPEFMVLTSTNKLPFDGANVTRDDVASIRSKLRELVFHPETVIDSQDTEAQRLIGRKRKLIANLPGSGPRRDWHQQLTEVNAALQPMVQPVRVRLSSELLESERELAISKILGSREFAWPLFPDSLISVLSKNARFRFPSAGKKNSEPT